MMPPMTKSSSQLLTDIEAFLSKNDMTATDFGVQAMNNSSFVRQLRSGGSITLRTLDRVQNFMRDYNPKSCRKKRRPRRKGLGSHLAGSAA